MVVVVVKFVMDVAVRGSCVLVEEDVVVVMCMVWVMVVSCSDRGVIVVVCVLCCLA